MRPKIFTFCFIIILLFTQTYGQQSAELKGDTVFVTTEGPVEIKFPAEIFQARLVDPNAAYKIVSVGHSVQISAKSEALKCASAIVDEGKRTHTLILCYKKDMHIENLNEAFFNYPTVKDLQIKAKQIEGRRSQTIAINPSPPTNSKESPIVKAAPNSSSAAKGSYYAIIEDGDKAFQSGLFEEALAKFTEVLRIQPSNDYARKRLSDVNIKIAEKERLAKKEADDKVSAIREAANKAFQAKQYDEALEGYKKVLSLQPNDIFSKSQLATIEKQKADNAAKDKLEKERLVKQDQENKINAIKATATKAFNEKRYDEASAGYTEVLSLNSNDVLAKSRLDAIQKIKEQDELKVKQEKENKNKEETFKTIVDNADKAFESKEYDVAKAGYQAAKDLKPNDIALEKKIKSTNDKILNKENEDAYNSAISSGDEAQKAKDYEKAKSEYIKASKIFKDRVYPQEQINAINKIINETTAKQNAEKLKQVGELESIKNYNLVIEKADKQLENKDFVNAKINYLQASKLKPDETYPKDKLSEIEILVENIDKERKAKADSAAALSEINKKYTLAIARGKAAVDKKDYDAAKIAYQQASELKPTEQEPKSKLDFIDKKLTSTGMNIKYDSSMAKGNLALGERNYLLALESYKEAQRIKPLETFALNQFKYVQELITRDSLQQAEIQRRAEIKVQEEIRKKRFDEGMTAYAQYEIAAQTADFEGQLLNLKHFLNIIPDASELNTYQFNAGAKIDFAKKKIQAIRDYLSRTKGTSYQLESIPYLDQDLEKKYESINFTSLPEGQVYAHTDSADYNENIKISRDLLKEKPRLTVVDSIDNIKLACQTLSFKGDRVFYKVLIHNDDSTEFLTGPMQINLIKKDGSTGKNYASYISSFPIILPGKEFLIVYVAKDQEVNDEDTLAFEVTDRLKKKSAHLSIPGKIYNQEKKLKL
ncbi:MAG: hypothetical protein JWQ09_420 [Segetibacter sp.]|nr:hypothetical protein [Segetibacter sp.]